MRTELFLMDSVSNCSFWKVATRVATPPAKACEKLGSAAGDQHGNDFAAAGKSAALRQR
jgi:hypothetical protein